MLFSKNPEKTSQSSALRYGDMKKDVLAVGGSFCAIGVCAPAEKGGVTRGAVIGDPVNDLADEVAGDPTL
jgi:hypothetical protein